MPLLDPEDDVSGQHGCSRSLRFSLVALNVFFGGYCFGIRGIQTWMTRGFPGGAHLQGFQGRRGQAAPAPRSVRDPRKQSFTDQRKGVFPKSEWDKGLRKKCNDSKMLKR